jgi:hypothetical protein
MLFVVVVAHKETNKFTEGLNFKNGKGFAEAPDTGCKRRRKIMKTANAVINIFRCPIEQKRKIVTENTFMYSKELLLIIIFVHKIYNDFLCKCYFG